MCKSHRLWEKTQKFVMVWYREDKTKVQDTIAILKIWKAARKRRLKNCFLDIIKERKIKDINCSKWY